ncbi:uncharacterized protein LOC116200885 [Punica granatum]|uniref:Uncharacterized protein n=2 Tax=Punica granatum TaxID=22663 RepID=A0A218W1H0_PUNGR|nr:uncharacterized protein LOC116200885 [Punica granatum]OWM66121.1 hypothetical protein CDL15_Pgr015548 [Punica granatum]PKI49063.1 hypothetical protein CRG98_030515 [Punica granatum]
MESAPRPPPPPAPPPPPEFPFPKESVTRRYKLIWRVLLISNLALGAYMFARPKKKDATRSATPVDAKKRETVEEVPVATDTSLNDWTADEDYLDAVPIAELVKVREPISEEQQRELFQWMLEEKRNLTPKNPEEKRQIDQDKAILKKFIRGKSVPSL